MKMPSIKDLGWKLFIAISPIFYYVGYCIGHLEALADKFKTHK